MATNNTITLYDLQLASGCTISPFVWATKYAPELTAGQWGRPNRIPVSTSTGCPSLR